MHPKDIKKTPEELAALKAAIQAQKQEAANREALKSVKNGQIIIFIMAGIMVISGFIEYNTLQMPEVWYIYAPIITLYLIMGIVYFRNPFVVSVIALVIYAVLLVIAISGDPSNLKNGIFIKFIIIAGLIRAIKYGKDYQVAVKYRDTGLLDDQL